MRIRIRIRNPDTYMKTLILLLLSDPSINPGKMEMYADPSARGGVLEPEATVEIKYRAR